MSSDYSYYIRPGQGCYFAIRIRLQNELLLINILAILLITIIAFSLSNVLRIILGFPFALFFHGYTLIAALFPRRNALDSIERVTLSFGLSITVVPLIGLILNYTPWGIKLEPILISIIIFIVVTSLIAWYRRHRLAEVERFTVSLNLSLPLWRGQGSVDKILSIILIAEILGAIGTLGYIIATPKVGKKFTEFHILGFYREPQYLPVDEKHSINPISVSKYTVEHYLYLYGLQYRLNYVVLRYPSVYDPRQNPNGEAGVVAIFASQMISGEQPTIFGSDTTRDYTHVSDVVAANLLAMERGNNAIYNIGT